MLLFLIAALVFIVVAVIVIKPVAMSHKKQLSLWLAAYGGILLFAFLLPSVKNEILTNVILVAFVVGIVFMLAKLIVKKIHYGKLAKAARNGDEDAALRKLVSGRIVFDDIAKYAIQHYTEWTGRVSEKTMVALASNPHTSTFILRYLSTEGVGYTVMEALASNRSTPPEALTVIAGQLNVPAEVIEAIIENPNSSSANIGLLIANCGELYSVLSGTSEHEALIQKGLAALKERDPALAAVEDRFILANYSQAL